MIKKLSILVPSYKRPDSLVNCIDSIVEQVEGYELQDRVSIFCVDDHSDANISAIFESYSKLSYFVSEVRPKNYGMSLNIFHMFKRAIEFSQYQLIITDDDLLAPSSLLSIINLLDTSTYSAIWTPKPSYLENGSLLCVACKPYSENKVIAPSSSNSAKYMGNGFILSGLIFKGDDIDFKIWEDNIENSFFPVLILGSLLCKQEVFYWNREIVKHTVLNICHWDRWGDNEVTIRLRLYFDYVATFSIVCKSAISKYSQVTFLMNAIIPLYKEVGDLLREVDGWPSIVKISQLVKLQKLSCRYLDIDYRIRAIVFLEYLFILGISMIKLAVKLFSLPFVILFNHISFKARLSQINALLAMWRVALIFSPYEPRK